MHNPARAGAAILFPLVLHHDLPFSAADPYSHATVASMTADNSGGGENPGSRTARNYITAETVTMNDATTSLNRATDDHNSGPQPTSRTSTSSPPTDAHPTRI